MATHTSEKMHLNPAGHQIASLAGLQFAEWFKIIHIYNFKMVYICVQRLIWFITPPPPSPVDFITKEYLATPPFFYVLNQWETGGVLFQSFYG